MLRIKCRFFLWIFLFLFLQGIAFSEEGFYSEHYHYKVKWWKIPAGEIDLKIVKYKKGILSIEAEAHTVGLAKLLMPFRSRWKTWIDQEGYPIKSALWRKNRSKITTKKFFFYQKKGYIKYICNNKKKIYHIDKKVYDELSAFLVAMKFKWNKIGETKSLWIFAHGKPHLAISKLEKKEKISTPWGKVTTYKIKTDFGFKSEMVNRAKKARFWIYQGRLVKAEGDLPLGHLTAILVMENKKDHARSSKSYRKDS